MIEMKIAVIALFVVAYYFIITGKIDKAGISFIAGAMIIAINSALKVVPSLSITRLSDFVDFDTIALLMGLMIIIPFMGDAGIFEYLALAVLKISRGNLKVLYLLTGAMVAVSSAFLNNVSTVMVFVPVILAVTETMDKDPFPFLMMIVFSSNFGGGMTLIGDPPNMIVGFAQGFSFIDFITNATPAILMAMVVTIFFFTRKERDYFKVEKNHNFDSVNPMTAIKDKKLAVISALTFVGAIAGFLLPDSLGISPSTIAILAAAVLLLIIRADSETMERVYSRIDWPTIFFFIGMFSLVHALERTGIATDISTALSVFIPNVFVLTLVIFWLSVVMAAILSAVPTVMIMIPIIHGFEGIFGGNLSVVWWALIMGQCVGGNTTVVGAAANMVVTGMSQKVKRGRIDFRNYLRYSLPAVLISGGVVTAYLVFKTMFFA